MSEEVREPSELSRRSDCVLVAEDDPVYRRLFQSWLQQWGYQVTLAEEGAAAWRELQTDHRPRLVLLDWMMPGVDGVEICRRVRALQRELYSYIVVATSRSSKQDTVDALEAGADDYVTKPVEANELRARMQVGRRILRLQDELLRSREQLRFQAMHDGLTGLLNRRSILQVVNEELVRSARSSSPLAALMLDLDHFKAINDTRGHQVGDAALVEVAGRVVQAVRTYDKVGRYGGEEFLVVLPDCDEDMLACVAERIRARIAARPVITGAAEVSLTLSAGGAVAGRHWMVDAAALIRAADHALYQAKEAGRNCCIIQPCLVTAAT